MRLLQVGCVALLLTACGGGGDDRPAGSGEAAPVPSGEGPAMLGDASITGMVRFSGTAPANPMIDMSEEPECVAKYTDGPTDPKVIVTNGGLANVFVYVKGGLPDGASFSPPAEPAIIDQDGCLYQPRVLGLMVGQDLEIRNSDPLLHNIKAVPTENRGFNISQPSEGMTSTRQFRTPEVMVPLECNVHSWMNAYIGVMDHPYFAVSGSDGSFAIEGLSPGTYELEIWHETLGTRTMSVTIEEGSSGATVDVDLGEPSA